MSAFRWTVAVLAVLGLIAGPTADAGTLDVSIDSGDGSTRLAIDLSTHVDDTTVVTPAELSAPEQAVDVGPGTNLVIHIPDEGTFGCTANFVWQSGSTDYLGSAGHCFLPLDKTATDGADADYDPSGVEVQACVSDCSFGGVTGQILSGTMVDLGNVVYARQTGETGDVGNDFGLVEIPAGVPIRTSMPVFGGPTSIDEELSVGEQVCHYGNGVVFGEVFPTMGRTGLGLFSDNDEFGDFFFEGAGSFGDSGSAVQTCSLSADGLQGVGAVGIFTHLTPIGLAGTTVQKAMEMADSDANLTIVPVLADGSTDASDPDDDGGNGGKNGGGPPDGKGPKKDR